LARIGESVYKSNNEEFNIKFKKYDLVEIIKGTRGRHSLPKAQKGKQYLIISHYTNNLGTTKYILIDKCGIQHFTTEKSARKVSDFNLIENDEWQKAKQVWMDETYVPVFGIHTYDYSGMPYVSSRDGTARLIKPIGNRNSSGVWINKSVVHDDDVKLFLSSSFPPNSARTGELSEAITFRIPAWIAEKKGFYNVC